MDILDDNGCTPLMYAAIADSWQAAEMLLNFSARREMVGNCHCLKDGCRMKWSFIAELFLWIH